MKEKLKQKALSLRWIFYISQRFSRVDSKGRSAVTNTLSALGVCLGVMTLIVTLGVMNGFQMEFIDAIMEISSYHLRVTETKPEDNFPEWCRNQKMINVAVPFYEAQGLMVGNKGKQSAVLLRAVPETVTEDDKGFQEQCNIVSGEFDLSGEGKIVLGHQLARTLNVTTGDKVSILALSGSSDVELLSQNRLFTVSAVFSSGYSDINSAYAFINIEDGKKYFGSGAKLIYGLKLKESDNDSVAASVIQKQFPESQAESWRSYNRTFFGALRVEKNILMLLVFLIFVVVAVNIYNGMRRMVYERREEIAVISALGGTSSQVQSVFIMQGFVTGLKGAVPGLLSGLLLCIKIDSVFMIVSKLEYYFTYFIAMLVSPESAFSIAENPMYKIYASIPARMIPSEILLITFFGIFSALAASWIASRGILKMTVAEVLRDE